MEKYEINQYIEKFETNLKDFKQTLKPEQLQERLDELTLEMSKEDFWNNQKHSTKIIGMLNEVKEQLQIYTTLQEGYQDICDLLELLALEESEEFDLLLEETILAYDKTVEDILIKLMLSGPYDQKSAIMEIHPGAGGTESMDWAEMLFRMYQRYCIKNNFKFQVLDYQPGDEAGIKSVTIQITGKNAYGMLKSERGVHRLVRISPFDSNARRHTSFASCDVSPFIDDVTDVKINEEDLKIDVFHSSGAGGQSVNTTDSAVRMTHKPTNIVVSCQNERSQIQNREQALKILKSKLLELEIKKQEDELRLLKGENTENAFGSQIRSYVFCPYTLVKDHRTGVENGNVNAVMDGDLELFIYSYLRKDVGGSHA